MRFWKLLFLLPLLAHCQTSASNPLPPPQEGIRPPIPENFRVAYVGDIGMTGESRRVLQMIKAENAGLFVLLGDYDYEDNPKGFEALLDKELGDVPLLAVVGNHDEKMWDDYKAILQRRLKKIPDARCEGEIGVKMRCEYKGIVFVLSGIGTMGMNHEAFLKKSLTQSAADFKVCAWHKNQHAMQAGNKPDETGWDVYEICREEGAMIATGHEHSYSRTFALSNFREQTRADKGDGSEELLAKGQSFAFVSGLGGKSIRAQKKIPWLNRFFNLFSPGSSDKTPEPWWAKVYTLDQKAQHSVLFCDYHVDKDPRKARCFLKNIDGGIVDEFTVLSKI